MPAPHPFTIDELEAMARMYAEGSSTRALASVFGVAKTTIRAALQRQGITLRGKSAAQRKYTASDQQADLTLHAQGLSPREISTQTGIAPATISRWAREAGQSRPNARAVLKTGQDGTLVKLCTRCSVFKPATTEYFAPYSRGYGGLYPRCLDCERADDQDRYAATKAVDAVRGALWRGALRQEVIAHYSGGTCRCTCCGEAHMAFLVVDHINGDGNKHRRAIGRTGISFYQWLRISGYPPGFRVLCHNCNHAYATYGACPHQAEHVDTADLARAGRTSREAARL